MQQSIWIGWGLVIVGAYIGLRAWIALDAWAERRRIAREDALWLHRSRIRDWRDNADRR
jgi:hypothetical protein